MDRFLLSGKQSIKIKEMREFRETVEELVDKSGVDFEFPEETEPSIGLKNMGRRLRILAILFGLCIFVIWMIFIESGASIIDTTMLFLGGWAMILLMCVPGNIIPAVIMYREEQEQFRLELRELIDIAEAAISVLKKQRRKSMNNKIIQAKKLIEEYRKYKL